MLELIYALTLSTATRTTCETYKSIQAVKERKKKKESEILVLYIRVQPSVQPSLRI